MQVIRVYVSNTLWYNKELFSICVTFVHEIWQKNRKVFARTVGTYLPTYAQERVGSGVGAGGAARAGQADIAFEMTIFLAEARYHPVTN